MPWMPRYASSYWNGDEVRLEFRPFVNRRIAPCRSGDRSRGAPLAGGPLFLSPVQHQGAVLPQLHPRAEPLPLAAEGVPQPRRVLP